MYQLLGFEIKENPPISDKYRSETLMERSTKVICTANTLAGALKPARL